MEDLVPALWNGQEVTLELSLEEHAKLGISHRENVCIVAGASDSGIICPASVPLSFWTPTP